MSCNTCQSKFTFFTRENACPSCGFSYCSKCLKYKCQLPNGTAKVCGPCNNRLMSNRTENSPASTSNLTSNDDLSHTSLAPIDIESKLNSLDNPVKPPIVIYKRARWENLKSGLDPVDQEIVDRLKKLKDHDKQPPAPTTEDIRRRLALLKDLDPDYIPPKNVDHVDTRSDQEKTDDLIQQYLERLELSSKDDPTTSIQQRLNALKGVNPEKSTQPDNDDGDDEDDEMATKKIIQKAIAEAALEAKYQNEELEEMDVEPPTVNSDDDASSSCCMCEQTKDLVSCTGCHNDLYCPICFEDSHDDFELAKHKTVPFKS